MSKINVLAAALLSAAVLPVSAMACQVEELARPPVGTEMPDGTLFAGISPDTCQAMFMLPSDATLTLTWSAAMQYAEELNSHGHSDWRLPTGAELNQIHRGKEELADTNPDASLRDDFYWSSTRGHLFSAAAQHMGSGFAVWSGMDTAFSVRPIRQGSPALAP